MLQVRCARAVRSRLTFPTPHLTNAAFLSQLAPSPPPPLPPTTTSTPPFDILPRPVTSSSWRSVNTRRARDAALRVRASADDAERALRGAVSLIDIATQLEQLRHPISPGQRVPDSGETAPPWSPSFIGAVFERCAQVRGEGGGLMNSGVNWAISRSRLLLSDTVYGERIRPTIVSAIKRAAFRPNVTEYSRILR
jgi:hypothetical protein